MISWPVVPGAAGYVVRWRRTDAANWTEKRPLSAEISEQCLIVLGSRIGPDGKTLDHPVPACMNDAILKGVRVDDWVFGVSSVSKDGFESPVASAVPGGAFKPYVAPPPEKK
jgi:hypothetical protein